MKVHTSLLKLRPSDFVGRFDATPEPVNSTSRACDETPIAILNIKASQFRSLMKVIYCPLMKVIYCPPSDKFFLSLPAVPSADIEEGDAWKTFIFYLDVASLAHQFGMHDIEKWAMPRLQSLVHTSGRKISSGLDGVSNDDGLGFNTMIGVEANDLMGIAEYATYEEGSRRPAANDNDIDLGDEGAEDEESAEEESAEEESAGEEGVVEVSDGDGEDDVNSNDNGGNSDEYDSDEDEDYCDSGQDSDSDNEPEEDDTTDMNDGQDSNQLIRAEDSPIFRFIDGIWYAKETSNTLLLHDI
ncbi:hypothetical protein RSAG8_10546, partial [Rhizoctonia solani AG-8 WAC10335]